MRQEHFEKKNKRVWDEYNSIIQALEKNPGKKIPFSPLKLPFLFRQICNHYALAISREYSPALINYIHTMALEGHKYLYKYKRPVIMKAVKFMVVGFPGVFRRYIVYFLISLSLFLLPALVTGVACFHKHEIIYSILDDGSVADVEYMYDPSNRKVGRTEKRGSDTNIQMFGFYIKNNIGIGFRTFAGGILAGIGTLFFLIYNGIFIGGISGYITRLGFTDTFWPFVIGHGSFELTAIVISGASGLMLAHSIIAPGNMKRVQALKTIAPESLKLVIGAALMLVIAAFIEAFWSSSSLPPFIKYSVAVFLWGLVVSYFIFSGRQSEI